MPITQGEKGGSLSGRGCIEAAPVERSASTQPGVEFSATRPRSVKASSWIPVAAGAALAAAVLSSPLPAYLFRLLVTFIHELGHSVSGWLFAQPAIPTVDFFFGGGVTLMGDRSLPLLLLIYLGFVWFGFKHRRNRRRLWLVAAFVPIYTLVVFTQLHTAVIIAAGHTAELLLAGLTLYLSVDSEAVKSRLVRMLCAFTGAFVLIGDTIFSFHLFANASFEQGYRQLGASGFRMDFSRIAEDYLHVDVSKVAVVFLIACLLTPIASFLCYRYGGRRRPGAKPAAAGELIDITSKLDRVQVAASALGKDQVASGRSG